MNMLQQVRRTNWFATGFKCLMAGAIVLFLSVSSVALFPSISKAQRMVVPQEIQPLFTQENLRFITQAQDRQPTLYFEDAEHNKGRYRQSHYTQNRPTVIYEGPNTHRVFIRGRDRDRYEQDLVLLHNDIANDRLATEPFNGATVFEFLGQWDVEEESYQIMHGSGGTVVTQVNNIPVEIDFENANYLSWIDRLEN
ncbi:MAG: hypothetical protein AAGD25_19180 [Cyanobacteria bacterium P01_F01_bin.150]